MDKPFFSIVIAIRNVAEELAATLDSLDTQSFGDFEVIIADCNSLDNPGRYLHNRPYSIQHIVQDDKGIYDAWNKVLPRAQGEWVSFLGAGDDFTTDQTLTEVADILNALPQDTLMAYGRIDVLGENGKVLHSAGLPWPEQLREIAGFGIYPHQSTFQRRSSLLHHGNFDSTLAIAGDIDMLLRLSKVRPPVFFDLSVARFVYGGISNKPASKEAVVVERDQVLKRHAIVARKRALVFGKARFVSLLNRFLPQRVLHSIIDLYRQITGRKPRFR